MLCLLAFFHVTTLRKILWKGYFNASICLGILTNCPLLFWQFRVLCNKPEGCLLLHLPTLLGFLVEQITHTGEMLPPTLFFWGLKNLSYQIPFMAERYLIIISAQSKSNWIPPRDLFVVCYFEKLCTAPIPASLKPEQCRAGQRKLGGFLRKSTRTHSWSDTIPQKEATVRRKQWKHFRSIFRKKEKCVRRNKLYSPDHPRCFWNLRGEGFVRVFPFMLSFLLKSLKPPPSHTC